MGVRRASNVPLRKNEQMDFIARLVATMAGLWVTTLLVPSISITSTTASETVIALAVIASLLVVLFLGTSIIATGMHGKAREDVAHSQSILDDAKSELQKVQEAIQ